MNLNSRVLRGFVVTAPAILLFLFGALTYTSVRRAQTTRDAVLRTHDFIVKGDALLGRLIDAETAERGFLLTGSESFLDPSRQASRDVSQSFVDLWALSHDAPLQRPSLRIVASLASARLGQTEALIRERRSHAFDLERQTVQLDRGKATMDSIRHLMKVIQARAMEQRSELLAAAAGQTRTTILIVIVGGALSILFALLINRIVVRANAASSAVARELVEKNLELQDQAVELELQNVQLQDTTAVLEERTREVECQSELLRSSEGRYEALVNGVSDGVILQDKTGAIVACNYTAERILGLTLSELTRPPAYRRWRVMREDGSSFPGEEFPGKLTLKSGEPQDAVVVRVERPGDTELWLLVSSRPILFGGDHERAAVTTFTDITARRQADALLHSEREMLTRILDAASEAVIACDSNGVLTYFNPAARSLSPVPPIGQGLETWEQRYTMLRADGRTPMPLSETPLFRALRGETVLRAELVTAPSEGTPRRFLANASPLNDAKGTRTGAVVVLHDITELARVQRALVDADDKLRQSQKMEAIGTLAGGIAHDFNNILTAVKSYSELLMEDLDNGTQQWQDVVEIDKAASRAAVLTQQLLAFSRQQVVSPQNLNLNEQVLGLLKMLERLIGSDIDLSTRLAADLGQIFADHGQVEQILLNLVVNARDAMPDGGKLTLETCNVDLKEEYVPGDDLPPPGHYVMLSVSDSGCGMSPQTRARIFEPFFTTKEKGKGTGLGLATVYGIVKQSNGYIWAYSEVDEGAVFKIYFPMTRASVRDAATLRPPNEKSHGSERILLVEDEQAVRAVASRILKKNGYQVTEAADGSEAFALWTAQPDSFDVVITDIVMPVMGGWELAERIREARPLAAILFMSGYTEDSARRKTVLAPGEFFLEKPFNPGSLAQKAREALDRIPSRS
jgi:two-component system cell cycle sensor histidine kinase/response regulator CckA